MKLVTNVKRDNPIARDTACHSEYPSTSEMLPQVTRKLGDEEDCKQYWDAAYYIIKKSGEIALLNELEKTHKIKVKGRDCYRPKLFRNKGWCQIVNPPGFKYKNTWGFCSSSCKVEYMKVYTSFN